MSNMAKFADTPERKKLWAEADKIANETLSKAKRDDSRESRRDDFYRSRVDNPAQYDRVIDLIKAINPYASANGRDAEDFAVNAVHSCISHVLFGDRHDDVGTYFSTGMCLAVRATVNPQRPNYNKVILALIP